MMTGCEKRSREMRTQRTVLDSRLAFFLARSGGRRAARAGDSTRQVEVPAPADAHEARLSDLESPVYVPAWHVSQVLGMVHSNGEADFGRLAQLRMQIQAREYGAAGLSVRVILHRDTDVTPKEAQYYWVFGSNADPFPGRGSCALSLFAEWPQWPGTREVAVHFTVKEQVAFVKAAVRALSEGAMTAVLQDVGFGGDAAGSRMQEEWFAFAEVAYQKDKRQTLFFGDLGKRDRPLAVGDLLRTLQAWGCVRRVSIHTEQSGPATVPLPSFKMVGGGKAAADIQAQLQQERETAAFLPSCPDCGSADAIRKTIGFKVPGSRLIDDRARALSVLYHQKRIPYETQPIILTETLRAYGHTVAEPFSVELVKSALWEGSVGAHAEIGLMPYKWSRSCPQSLTVVIDAASIKEEKYEGMAVVRKVYSREKGKSVARFVRLGLGLCRLASGTDLAKMEGLLHTMNVCIDAFNAVHAPNIGEQLKMVDIAMCLGYSTNDHAESVVKNQFVPFMNRTLLAALGSVQDIMLVLLVLQRNGIDATLRTLLVEKVWSAQATKVQRNKLVENQGFCHTHKLVLVMDAALAGAAKFQRTDPLAEPVRVDPARPGRPSGSAASSSTREVGKSMGKGKFSETLSHGALFEACREWDNLVHLHFERWHGSRGNQAVFGNALATFLGLIDAGEWGIKDMLDKLDAKNKGDTNKLHTSLREHAASDMTIAELRMCALLCFCVFRPVQTFTQSHASVEDMINVVQEYRALVDKLCVITDLSQLPWIDTAEARPTVLLRVAETEVVLHSKTAERRLVAITAIFDPPGLPAERKSKQDQMMPPLLRYMAEGMRDKINDLMAPKYNGQVFDLPPGDPKRLNYREQSATSDPIERYFGKASYLRKANPNQSVWHLNNMMAITETNFGTRLVNTLNTDPDEFHRIMDACRKHRPAFEKTAREWEQTAARTIMTNLRQFLLDSQKKKVDVAVELARLEQLAEDFEFPATAAAQAVHRAELLSGLVKKHE